jgi:hypothetical protein
MNSRFLKLGSGYLLLWCILVIVIGSKVFLIRDSTVFDLVEVGLFGVVMLVVSYFGAWAVWNYSGKDQRTGELSYLGIMTVVFLVRTVMLYAEAIAAR